MRSQILPAGKRRDMTPEEIRRVQAVVEWPDRENIPDLDREQFNNAREAMLRAAPTSHNTISFILHGGYALSLHYEKALSNLSFLPPELSMQYERIMEELRNGPSVREGKDPRKFHNSLERLYEDDPQRFERELQALTLGRAFAREDFEALKEALKKVFGKGHGGRRSEL